MNRFSPLLHPELISSWIPIKTVEDILIYQCEAMYKPLVTPPLIFANPVTQFHRTFTCLIDILYIIGPPHTDSDDNTDVNRMVIRGYGSHSESSSHSAYAYYCMRHELEMVMGVFFITHCLC